ncbi:TPA: hypothetical protein DCP13_01980 [Candidatus Azambacteria bacterium]|nr:MAG: hypothetical protein UX55_C0047G0002 [Candidatus Azambacteria bacterium GW2011_GWE2_46_45]HAM95714.1 hypothetical protein [Candidatus Azambacteria bacterium]HAQ05548.1 hypothetical protein [Candidatus Azambacteria bacterium]HBA52517.1 hypothetical protein [Candidatus Azambacteria bacterium]HBC59364.1 hypothetical protein [Candidatus Azambacteria bacterium]
MGIIIVALALVAVTGAAWVMLWGMGFFQYLGGKKKSPSAVNKEALKEKILALNSAELPYQITSAKESDLSLEWKIVDAKWYGIFSKEKISKTYRALVLLDDVRKTARYYEELGSVEWHLGTDGLWKPSVKYSAEVRRGRILFQKSWGVQYGIKESGKLGKVYEYKFDIGYARDPLKKTVLENNWEFVPVVRKQHALYKSLK